MPSASYDWRVGSVSSGIFTSPRCGRHGLFDAALADHNEVRPHRLHTVYQGTDSGYLLPAQQTAKVTNEHQHRDPVGPQLSEADPAPLGIEGDHVVENVRHGARRCVRRVE